MLKITAAFRDENPLKVVMRLDEEYAMAFQEDVDVILADDLGQVSGKVTKAYNNPHGRRLAWIEWDGTKVD